ncbi:MAG: single-stranded-DNA-specific exonuclease RecJ [Clostridia bacterium]|nr:single-stranded-DNA-specific exonuclease RecJ [Clostridia bacterium]
MTRWVFAKPSEEVLKGPEGVPQAILQILKERGVATIEDIEDFLSPFPQKTYDPLLLPDMAAAATLILKTADSGGRICIYGDYDADGVTSVALLLSAFNKLSTTVCYYIPSRFREGYGLNKNAIKDIAEKGVSLIVTVDCGSTAIEEVNYAKELGLDIIITDHHSPCEEAYPSCLFVNPKRRDSHYPFRELSGCGVAFKLLQSIQRLLEEKCDGRFSKADLYALLDLVAISTVADIVSLMDENRTLVKYGLERLNRQERPGLKALFKVLDIADKRVDAEHIGYLLAPNINALGRMQSADAGAELLCANGKTMDELMLLAQNMVLNNNKRKEEQDKTRILCQKIIAENESGELFPVIYAKQAHEGVAGIVAGNLKEALYRPVFIVTPTGSGRVKGTGRSIPGVNMHEIITEVAELFDQYGGHAGACGFSMKEENLNLFRKKMQEAIKKRAKSNPDIFEDQIYIAKTLSAEEKTVDFAKFLRLLEPYGENNPKPIFCVENVRVSSFSLLGKEGQHLRFLAEGKDGTVVPCILFQRAGEFSGQIENGAIIDVAGELSVNEYNKSEKVQMKVKDIKRSHFTW